MSLVQRITSLRKRHSEIDGLLQNEEARPLPDITKVHGFKREKLRLKDEIVRLMVEDGGHRSGEQRQSA